MDPNWQEKSKQNSENRQQQQCPSFHGTQSYINARHKKMNPETQEIQGAIDNWHGNHYKEKRGGWPNDATRLAYEKLVAEKEKEIQSQQASSTSSNGNITVNEREIFQMLFGTRSELNGS